MSDYSAAIDLGTNTARLLIVDCLPSGITPVLVEREIVRLGGGFTDKSGLSAEACQRGLLCMLRFSNIIASNKVTRVKACATSAVRDAVNGLEFVEKIYSETGIRLKIIDGETEARLTLEGVKSALDSCHDSLVLLDVGGGSTEFTVSFLGNPVFIKSMPIGVVRLTEGFNSVMDMVERVNSVLDDLELELMSAGIHFDKDSAFVGTAGTATTIAAIKLKMVDYNYRMVNNFSVSRVDIEEIFRDLLEMSTTERLRVKGLEKGREDLIIAGLVIITSVMDRFKFDHLKVSDFGLLEGLALSCGDYE